MQAHAFWDQYMKCYDELNSVADYREYLDDLTRRSLAGGKYRVLDAGSGTGNLSVRLRDAGADVTSLDFSASALEIHKQKDPQAKQICASLEEPLPLPSDHFDSVVCASVIFTLSPEGQVKALDEFKRVLKPGGKLLITSGRPEMSKRRFLWDHLRAQWRRLDTLAFLRRLVGDFRPLAKVVYYNYLMYALKRIQHYHRFSKDEILNLAVRRGFVLLNYGVSLGGRLHLVEVTKPAV